MSRIDLQIVATGNFAALEGQLARLKSQIATLNTLGVGSNPQQLRNIQSYSTAFANALSASGMFQNRMVNLTSETEKFGKSLERGNLRLSQYFRAGAEHARKQQGQIRALAREQVRMMNSTTMAMGDGRAMVISPKGVDEAIDKQKILNQEHRIFRQVVQGGATQLINWGKNTQWAGRQLTVGLTVPLTIFGAMAGKVFMDADKQLTRMAKVYGDASKGMVNTQELDAIRGKTLALAQEIASTMGVAVSETLGIAADIAATGKEGNELLDSTREAMRLSVLGEVDRQEAMKATLAIQSVFKQDTEGLTNSINLLNAVENQTSTTLDDLTIGIIKAGPVVQGLGGSIADLASMMVAMREGGIPASEAANAIKSSLGGLINPTKQTTELLKGFGVNLTDIVDRNAGDVIGTLVALQEALDGLDELSRQRAIEQMFGKFQFSRINALLNNLNKAGSQTEQVLKIAGMSTTQLAQTADRELKLLTESASMRFTRAVESLKASLIPIGETFVDIGAKLINVATTIIDAFNDLPEGLKTFIKILAGITAIAGPIIMITGVFGNFFGYIIKTVGALMALRRGAKGVFEFYTADSIAARASTELLSKGMFNQVEATNVLKAALETLNVELQQVATNMRGMGAAAATASQQARAAATASATAVVAAQSPLYTLAGRASKGAVAGFERSHLIPGLKDSGRYSYQTGATLLPAGSAAGEFQRMGFAPTNFFGEGAYANKTREQILKQQQAMQTQRGRAAFTDLSRSPEQMARLLPTRQEYSASAGQYMATLKQLQSLAPKTLKEMSQQMQMAISRGDIESAKNILNQAINANSVQFKELVTKETTAVASINGTLDQVVTKVMADEAKTVAALKAAGMQGILKSGKGIDQFIYAITGGGGAARYGATGGQAAVSGSLGTRVAPNERIMAKQAQIDAIEEQRMAVKRKLFAIESNITQKQQNIETLVQEQQVLENEKKALSTKRKVNASKIAEIDAQIAILAAKEAADRRSLRSSKGAATTKANQIEQLTAQKRSMEANREVMIRRRLTGELIRSNNVEQSARAGIAMALTQEKSSLLKRISSLEKVTIGDNVYYAMVDKYGKTIAYADAVKRKLITVEQANQIRYTALGSAISQEMMTMNMSSRSQRKVATFMESLSVQVRDQIVSHELVQQANGRYILALKNAEGKILAQSAAFGTNARLGRGISTAGMLAGMGTMFTMGQDNAAAKIGSGALMGVSMGAMTGNPWLAVGGLVAGAAIPALMEYQKAQQKVNDELIKYGEALNGSSLIIDQFASEMGKLKPSEKLAAAISGVAMPEKTIESGKALLDTEAGQRLRETSRMFGGDQLRNSLLAQLQRLTLMEIFTPQEAKDVAQTLAVELGNPALGESLVAGINSVLNEDGTIKDNISQLFLDTIPEIQLPEFGQNQINDYLTNRSWTDTLAEPFTAGINFVDEIVNDFLNDFGGDSSASREETERAYKRFAQQSIGPLAASLDQLTEAQALATTQFMKGELTFEQYSSQMETIQKRNIEAADAMLKLKESGADIGAMLKDIADQAGRGADYSQIEGIGKNLFESLSVGERFLSQIQVAAAYGDITLGDMKNLETIIANEDTRRNIELIFDVKGAEDNAVQIIKLLGMGMDAEFIADIVVRSEEIGKPISEIYGMLSAVSGLPPNIQKTIISNIQSDPDALTDLINKYEYANSLPDSKKELRLEIFGNEYLTEIQENWKQFIALPDEERKTAVVTTLLGYEYSFAQPALPTPTEVSDLAGPDTSAMISSLTGGSSGGSGGGSDAANKAIDKKIAQQDKIIKQIQKEREERQKLLDLEKKALDFAMKQQDLESQIMIAKAEGRLADAALLQSQLDANEIADREDEKERLRQEREDKRIRAAERRKKQLEKQKEDSSGGGGSGGGGPSDAELSKIETRLEFLNNQLASALNNNVEILSQIEEKGASAFWESEPIKNYIKEAQKLGIPLEVINEQLETTFDYLVTQGFKDYPLMTKLSEGLREVGIYGSSLEKILPNIFAIMQDKSLTKDEVIASIAEQFRIAGMKADEARKAAEKFFNTSPVSKVFDDIDKFKNKFDEVKDEFDPNQAKIISEEYAAGIRKGLTKEEIWSNISRRISDAVYKDSDLDPLIADKKAAATAQALQTRVTNDFKDFDVKFPIKSEYTSNAPEWLEGALNQGYVDKGMRALGFTVEHNGNFTTTPSSTPQEVTGTVNISGVTAVNGRLPVSALVGAALGGLIKRGTGGMIYGPGGPTEDRIPTMLSNGEYVIRASSVDKYGIPFLDMVNMGTLPALGRGGYSKYPNMVGRMSMGGAVYYNSGGIVDESPSNVEYNINVNVAGSNASADEIAKEVMSAIERKQRMTKTVNRI
jgi:TP901 family phage tail tape measure protein